VTDPHSGPKVAASLEEDSFVADGDEYSSVLVDARTVEAAKSMLPAAHDLFKTLSAGGLSPTQLARVEQRLWPAKLLDGALANYIVSIQPRWANELFSLQDTLLERPSLLGLSREHVYYRSPGGNPTAPARLLWYASGTGRNGIGAVVATSQLAEVVTDTAARLYRRFAHLGVYRLDDIASRAKRDCASALRFVDTERFPQPVTLERLRSLNVISQTAPLLSPLRIDAKAYGVVYEKGTGRRGS
jgi:predicted transcriptional regulator